MWKLCGSWVFGSFMPTGSRKVGWLLRERARQGTKGRELVAARLHTVVQIYGKRSGRWKIGLARAITMLSNPRMEIAGLALAPKVPKARKARSPNLGIVRLLL